MNAPHSAKSTLPADATGHFVLHLYRAIADLLAHVTTLAEASGETMDAVLERHPFLAGYMAEIERAAGAEEHFRAPLAALERAAAGHLPVRALAASAELGDGAVRLLFLAALVEEDLRFGPLFAWLQPGCGARRPTLELAERILAHQGVEAALAVRALAASRCVLLGTGDLPRTEWTLRPPPALWAVLRGEADAPPPCGRLAARTPTVAELALPRAARERLGRAAALLAQPDAPRVLALRVDPGADVEAVAGALARVAGRRLLVLNGMPSPGEIDALGPWLTAAAAAPLVVVDPGPGETVAPPDFPAYAGPLVIALGRDGGVASHGDHLVLTFDIAPLALPERRVVWARVLGERAPAALEPCLDALRLSDRFIRQVGEGAVRHAHVAGREAVLPQDIAAAARALNHVLLDGLAERLEPYADPDQLVAAPQTLRMLAELTRFARSREGLAGNLGAAFQSAPDGVRALFTGVSGTGKTMAARLLAGALGKDLYRIDLAAVVNKYIGETEKNLNRVLSRAEALDVVLLLDEGDALLGARTEVKTANDRYANLETNYLLQRLEHYRGIILVTTNYGENIDKAFQRRMDVVVPFFRPDADERAAILARHLPLGHTVEAAALTRLMERCDLTGGQLRNVALRATIAASARGGPADEADLTCALETEYEKAGSLFPEPRRPTPPQTPLAPFLRALRASR